LFSIPGLSWLYNPMFTPRVHAGKWQTYRIKIEKTTRFIFEHLTHAWKIHSRGFYSNSRWNVPVPGFKWKHWCLLTSNLAGSRPTFAVGSSSEGIFQLNDRYQRIDLDLGNTSKDVISLDVNMKSGDVYFFTKKVIMWLS